ncbi:hypothetical protein [Chitinophaga vietnamensis]|uniref:hypothetical protein n=1 Tax=Chitinophaga vietnamensis TaxID=2593957 RepID=UPI00191BFDA6|nr:hypothetical protein [Chitinophaga vietnamensis]
MDKKHIPNLWVCILMDLLGCASYAIPLLGEASDVIWAPISAFIFYRMFGGTLGTFGGFFNFLEELFPGTDFIPTFTISWIIKRIMATEVTPPGKTA